LPRRSPVARSSHPLDHLALTPLERRRLLVRLLAEVVLRLQGESGTAPSRHLDQAEDDPEEAPSLAEKEPEKSSVSGLASGGEQSVDVQGA